MTMMTRSPLWLGMIRLAVSLYDVRVIRRPLGINKVYTGEGFKSKHLITKVCRIFLAPDTTAERTDRAQCRSNFLSLASRCFAFSSQLSVSNNYLSANAFCTYVWLERKWILRIIQLLLYYRYGVINMIIMWITIHTFQLVSPVGQLDVCCYLFYLL